MNKDHALQLVEDVNKWVRGTKKLNDSIVMLITDLPLVVGGCSSHVVVHGGQDWDGIAGHINPCEDHGSLRDSWQAGLQHLGWKVGELKEDVVLLWSHSSVKIETTSMVNPSQL